MPMEFCGFELFIPKNSRGMEKDYFPCANARLRACRKRQHRDMSVRDGGKKERR